MISSLMRCFELGCNCYTTNTIPYQKSVMTIKELLLQEIENTPEELLDNLLVFLKSLKATPDNRATTYVELLERIDYLEAIVGIRKGLEEFDRGEGIPADVALERLQRKLNIPPRS
jgi:hypothetical protein